jgi:hypothetical protein
VTIQVRKRRLSGPKYRAIYEISGGFKLHPKPALRHWLQRSWGHLALCWNGELLLATAYPPSVSGARGSQSSGSTHAYVTMIQPFQRDIDSRMAPALEATRDTPTFTPKTP